MVSNNQSPLLHRDAWLVSAPCKATLIAALLAALVAAPAAAAGDLITVEGNRRVDAEAIKAHFHLGPGGAADPAALDTALKELYATEAFEDVRITRADGHLVVR